MTNNNPLPTSKPSPATQSDANRQSKGAGDQTRQTNKNTAVDTVALTQALSTAAALAASAAAQTSAPGLVNPRPLPTAATTAAGNPPYASLSSAAPLHPAGLPSATAAPPGTHFPVPAQPPIFHQSKLRRGKWTPEEEKYADFVIGEFEKGTLEDCDNGSTLRSFLSRKLHCAPMRISKKYAGKGIGKQVFLSRLNTPSKPPPAVLAASQAKLRKLQANFYKSLLQEMEENNQNHTHPGSHFMTPQGLMLRGHNNVFSQPIQMTPGSLIPFIPSTTSHPQQPLAPMTLPLHPSHSVRAPTPAPSSTVGSGVPPTPAPAPPAPTPAGPSAAEQQLVQQQLHLTYLKALDQMKANFTSARALQTTAATPVMSNNNSTASSKPQATNGGTNVAPPRAPSVRGHSGAQSVNPAPIPLAPATAKLPAASMPPQVPQPYGAAPPAHVTKPPAVTQTAQALPPQPRHSFSIQPQPLPSPALHSLEIPDFLSGFEKVAANGKPKERMSSASTLWSSDAKQAFDTFQYSPTTQQFTPTFTSRSFDDFHQLLGSDCSPGGGQFSLDGSAKDPQAAIETRAGQAPAHGTTRAAVAAQANTGPKSDGVGPMCADSYALFAQQSAFEVSQHSAYHRPGAIPTSQRIMPSRNAPSNRTQPQHTALVHNIAPLPLAPKPANPGGSTSPQVMNAANLAKMSQQQSPGQSNQRSANPLNTMARQFGAQPNIVSGSERSSEVGTASFRGSSGDSSTGSDDPNTTASDEPSDESSDNRSNYSDSISEEGPRKKRKKSQNPRESGGSVTEADRGENCLLRLQSL